MNVLIPSKTTVVYMQTALTLLEVMIAPVYLASLEMVFHVMVSTTLLSSKPLKRVRKF